jgi:hypothetical protein
VAPALPRTTALRMTWRSAHMSAAPAQPRSPARPGPETPRAKQTRHPATSGGLDGRQGAGRRPASSRWQRISSDGVLGHIVGASIGRGQSLSAEAGQ